MFSDPDSLSRTIAADDGHDGRNAAIDTTLAAGEHVAKDACREQRKALTHVLEHTERRTPRYDNIGNHTPVELTEFVRLIEEAVGRPAIRELVPMQPGEILETCADVADLEAAIGFRPKTPIDEGVRRFVAWYRGYVA